MACWECEVLGSPIRVQAERLDDGWDISVTGGVKTHVGAVTLAGPDGREQTIERPGHRDSHISRTWALALAEAWKSPVCVRCGIHYDNASKEEIELIVSECGRLLERIIKETV